MVPINRFPRLLASWHDWGFPLRWALNYYYLRYTGNGHAEVESNTDR